MEDPAIVVKLLGKNELAAEKGGLWAGPCNYSDACFFFVFFHAIMKWATATSSSSILILPYITVMIWTKFYIPNTIHTHVNIVILLILGRWGRQGSAVLETSAI